MDGKVKHYSFGPGQTLQIVVASTSDNMFRATNTSHPTELINFRRDIYRAVKMNDGLGGVAYAMHPDGSMFFEWYRPRGSRR